MNIKNVIGACTASILFTQVGQSSSVFGNSLSGELFRDSLFSKMYDNMGLNSKNNSSIRTVYKEGSALDSTLFPYFNNNENMNEVLRLRNSITEIKYDKNPYLGISDKVDSVDLGIEKSNSDFKDIEDAIIISSKKYGLDPKLVAAVIKQESNFNKNCVSSCGAIGLMQIMPNTIQKFGVTDPYDIYQNIDAGTRHLKGMIDRYSGDEVKGVAAYNLGGNALDKSGFVSIDDVSMLPKETRIHVRNIFDYYKNGINV